MSIYLDNIENELIVLENETIPDINLDFVSNNNLNNSLEKLQYTLNTFKNYEENNSNNLSNQNQNIINALSHFDEFTKTQIEQD